MNRRFRREYFVEKSPDAVINKRGWITAKGKNLFKVLKFTLKRPIRGADIEAAEIKERNRPFLYVIGMMLVKLVKTPVEVGL